MATKKNHPSIRIFKSPFLEALTHVHPSIPLILWTPVMGYFLYLSFTVNGLRGSEFALVALISLFVWSLVEYALHRFVFHMPVRGPMSNAFVYLFHGLHHDDPDDPTRLVMPPVPAVLMMGLLYFLFGLLIPERYFFAFLAFFLSGYLCYDYIHYATHHFKMNNSMGRFLKKWHLQHHYRHEKAKYGVSSPLWDYVFHSVTGAHDDHPLYTPERIQNLNRK